MVKKHHTVATICVHTIAAHLNPTNLELKSNLLAIDEVSSTNNMRLRSILFLYGWRIFFRRFKELTIIENSIRTLLLVHSVFFKISLRCNQSAFFLISKNKFSIRVSNI